MRANSSRFYLKSAVNCANTTSLNLQPTADFIPVDKNNLVQASALHDAVQSVREATWWMSRS